MTYNTPRLDKIRKRYRSNIWVCGEYDTCSPFYLYRLPHLSKNYDIIDIRKLAHYACKKKNGSLKWMSDDKVTAKPSCKLAWSRKHDRSQLGSLIFRLSESLMCLGAD